MNTFRILDLFPSSGEGVGDTYTVGSLRKKPDDRRINRDYYAPSSEAFRLLQFLGIKRELLHDAININMILLL
jgi:hypothetical protein